MAPLKLLLSGYALSALAALGFAAAGAPALASALVFWLGGAAAVFALALTPGVRGGFRNHASVDTTTGMSGEDAAASLVSLERDRIADTAVRDARAAG